MNVKTKIYYEFRVPGDGEFEFFVEDFSDSISELKDSIAERFDRGEIPVGSYFVKITQIEERL